MAFDGKECIKEAGLHSSFSCTTVQISITFEIRNEACTKIEKTWFLTIHWLAKTAI